MRCYRVLVHGRLDWAADEVGAEKPAGFYCHRYVLAANEQSATATAFRRVRLNLDDQMGWLRDGLATVELEADEIQIAPIHRLLKPDNRGHAFYERE